LRIAVLHDLLDSRGGAERTLLSSVRLLEERGHQVSIYTLLLDRDRCFTRLLDGVNVNEIGVLKGHLNRREDTTSISRRLRDYFGRLDPAKQIYLIYALKTFSNLELDGYDVVHASNYPASDAAALIKKKHQIPAIWGCNEPYRDLWLEKEREEPYLGRVMDRTMGSLLRSLDRRLVPSLDGIYVNSRYTQNLIQEIYGIRSTIIYPGIDIGQYSSNHNGSEIKDHYCPRGERLLLTVSRLYPAKRIDILIRSLRAVKRAGEKVRLLIIGEGPDRTRLERITEEMGVREEVSFRGSLPDTVMREYFAAADIFVFAAPDEPWGLVVLEAMASRLPVIVPTTGGSGEIVEDGITGLYTRQGTPREYAERILTLLRDEELAREIGNEAEATVKDRFHIEGMVDSLEELYLQTITRTEERAL